MAKRKSMRAIGLILSNVTNDFSGYLMEQMERQFTANGYKLIVTTTNRSVASERDMLKMFGQITDGILIISDAISYEELADFVPDHIPVIFLNRKPLGCPHTCIIENNYAAVFQAVLSNATSGHDKIALVCSNRELSTTKEIVSAYKSAMESTEAGFHEDWIYYTGVDVPVDPKALISDIKAKGCHAILTGTQTLTRKFWDHLLVCDSHNPNPLTLIGFSNKNSDSQSLLNFDTIAQPLQELTELSVQQMLYLIHNPETLAHEYFLRGTLRTHTLNH